MGFLAGSVSFSRFRVVGGSPKRLDDNLMEKFRAHAVGKQRVMRSDREEIGWIGGRHLLDREFDAEKNVILECLHFGLRIDSHKVPPDIMRAYVQMEIDALRKHGDSAKGAAFAKLKKQAVESAKARAEQEVKEGRYRSQKQFPILWDTRTDTLYFGSTSSSAIERLQSLFRDTFEKRLEPLTAGAAGYEFAGKSGVERRVESMRPARFVAQPDGNGHTEVYWSTRDPSSRDYLGNEFALWLWYTLAEESDTLPLADSTEAAVVIVKQLALECPWAQNGRAVMTAEGPARLAESRVAVGTGKLPRKMGMIVTRQGSQYEFVLTPESLAVAGAILPPVSEEAEGRERLEERVEQVRHLGETVDLLYQAFLGRRLSSEWDADLARMSAWLGGGKRQGSAAVIAEETESVAV
ncbi:MAG: hypothetical protein AABZ08_03415 [Planctomycetota bacterium]